MYIIDRARLALQRWCDPNTPHLTREIVDKLDRYLAPHMVGLEWGSGASTAWLAQRCRHLVSIEHQREWYERIAHQLESVGLRKRVDLRLYDVGATRRIPSGYVGVVDELTDESLDFVLVDGRKRDSCVIRVLPKLRGGGWLVVDDVSRFIPRDPPSRMPGARSLRDGYASSLWRDFAEQTRDWPCHWATNGVWETAVWVKPDSKTAEIGMNR